MKAEGKESNLSDILKEYWDKLPERVKEVANEARILRWIDQELGEELRAHCVPAYISEEPAKKDKDPDGRTLLIFYADSGTARMAVKVFAGELINKLAKVHSVKIDEVKVFIRASRVIKRTRLALTGRFPKGAPQNDELGDEA